DLNGKLLGYSIGGKVQLDNTTGNLMATAAFKTDTTTAPTNNGTVTYKGNTALTISTVAAAGTLSAVTGVAHASTVGPLSGITTVAGGTNGAVVVQSNGLLTVDQAILTTPSGVATNGGSVTLEAQTGGIMLT